jgi:hypothetical protein
MVLSTLAAGDFIAETFPIGNVSAMKSPAASVERTMKPKPALSGMGGD